MTTQVIISFLPICPVGSNGCYSQPQQGCTEDSYKELC